MKIESDRDPSLCSPYCRRAASLALAGLLLLAAVGSAEDKSKINGPVTGWRHDGSGVFQTATPPTDWSADRKVVWKTKLPGHGISSPVVVNGRVLTTAEPTELVCLDTEDGQIVWQRSHSYGDLLGEEKGRKVEEDLQQAEQIRSQIEQLKKDAAAAKQSEDEQANLQAKIDGLEKQFDALTSYPPVPKGTPGNTTSTPVTDGQRVWAVFGTGIVSSHTLDGEQKWMKFIEAPRERHSASPLLADGLLIVHLSDLIALDADTGEVVWRTATPARAGSPVLARIGTTTAVVTPAGAIVAAKDGKLLSDKLFDLAYCSPIVVGDVCFAVENGTTKALRLEQDDAGKIQVETLWESRGARDHRLGSPVYRDGLLYAATSEGILEVVDGETGDLVYRERLDLGKGRVDPSLAMAGEHLYVSSHLGTTLVLDRGREFEEISRNQLENFSSSPLFQNDQLYVRTNQHLYRIDRSDK